MEKKSGAPKGIIFFKTFFYKSFPFYNWTFGAYLIFMNVNSLVYGTEKGGPQRNRSFWGPFLIYCSIHQRVNINENQICSKCSVIKWETFIKKVLKRIIPLGAPLFFSIHQRVRKNLIFIHPQGYSLVRFDGWCASNIPNDPPFLKGIPWCVLTVGNSHLPPPNLDESIALGNTFSHY